MVSRRRQQFVYGYGLVLCGTLVVMAATWSVEADMFFVVALVSLLALIEVTKPVNITPAWYGRLRWLIALGLVGFAYIVVRRMLALLPPGIL